MSVGGLCDPATGLARWDLADGRYVLADSSIDGGGLRIMRAGGRAIDVGGTAAVNAEIGAGHPAVAGSAEATGIVRAAQATEAGVLAQILRDGAR